jgi:xanthine dehydrogenase accessory factor
MPEPSPPIPRTALPDEVLRAALAALDGGRPVVIASVIARRGSAPSTPGQKLALLGDGTAVGTIGGGAVERVVLAAMAVALADPASLPRVETFRLGPALGMCCGGAVDLLIEPLRPPAQVLVVGAGHVGVALGPLLASLGFRVTLCDAREEAADASRLPREAGPAANGSGEPAGVRAPAGVRLVHAEHDDPEVLRGFAERLDEAALVVMTHDHQVDQAAIEWALGKGFGFVGGVGSRAKAARTRARLSAKGLAERDLDRVRMPVGVDIGARAPAEIAVSIAAELIEWRARRLAHVTSSGHDVEPEAAASPLAGGEVLAEEVSP